MVGSTSPPHATYVNAAREEKKKQQKQMLKQEQEHSRDREILQKKAQQELSWRERGRQQKVVGHRPWLW